MKIGKLASGLAAIAAVAVEAWAASVTLSWEPSPDSPVTYTVLVNSTNIAATNIVGTLQKVDGLVGGQLYSFNVVAVDTNNIWSEFSNTTTYFTPSEGLPPAPALASQDGETLNFGAQWLVTLAWKPAPPAFVVTNYLMVIRQGALLRTNQVGTNLSGAMTVAAFNTTEAFLQAQNNQGFSPLVQVGNYRKPGSSKFLKVTQP